MKIGDRIRYIGNSPIILKNDLGTIIGYYKNKEEYGKNIFNSNDIFPLALVKFDNDHGEVLCECSNLELLENVPQACTCDFYKTILVVGCQCGGV